MDDKLALRISQAGMRLIAQMTIYNSGDFERLQTYLVENYHPDLLAVEALDERIDDFRYQYETLGRVRVRQVIGTGKHHVMVLLEAERSDDYFLNELKVEEDYPHRISEYSFTTAE
ncbi:MAG: hypothetical protein ABI835_20225 [Chloroflexota bacterium]